MEILTLLAFLAVCDVSFATVQGATGIPLRYAYGGKQNIMTDIVWNANVSSRQVIPAVVDTTAVGMWVYGPKSTINDGSEDHDVLGECIRTVQRFYDWEDSPTVQDVKFLDPPVGYGFNDSKQVVASFMRVNDTIGFENSHWPEITNIQIGIAGVTRILQRNDGCKLPESSYDLSVIGMAGWRKGGHYLSDVGPSLRYSLWSKARTPSQILSMWFDRHPKSIYEPLIGTAMFGNLPRNYKYTGTLMRVKTAPPPEPHVGYYVKIPKVDEGRARQTDETVKRCHLDSSSSVDRLPFDKDAIVDKFELVKHMLGDQEILAYNSSCDSMPLWPELYYTFDGDYSGSEITIRVPLRNFARGLYDSHPDMRKDLCGLSLVLDEKGSCTLGAPFFVAVFIVFHDDHNQIAMAQGNFAGGSELGPQAIFEVDEVHPGNDIPGAFNPDAFE